MISRISNIFKINWFATIYINFKSLDLKSALQLPIIVYRGFIIKELKGKIIFKKPVQFGMVGFGQPYEIFTKGGRKGEAIINGHLIINGRVQFGIDSKLYIKDQGVLCLGHINSFAARTEVICYHKISIENWVQFGNDCLICDTNFHELKNITSNELIPMNHEITIGSHNYIGARTTIKGRTVTPDYCTVATNSLLNRNYSSLGSNVVVGGIPAAKIKDNIARDWESEKDVLEKYLTIKL